MFSVSLRLVCCKDYWIFAGLIMLVGLVLLGYGMVVRGVVRCFWWVRQFFCELGMGWPRGCVRWSLVFGYRWVRSCSYWLWDCLLLGRLWHHISCSGFVVVEQFIPWDRLCPFSGLWYGSCWIGFWSYLMVG